MEAKGMEDASKSEVQSISAAAFVEGGIQEACEDACSICLEAFCDSEPSTVTTCKHEYHLQCILEWCQRSSQCPMCWQPISLKDPSSQELLEAVEWERNFRFNPSRNATIFHHPTLGDFELQHLPVGATDSELEERIIQHLAAAAAMGRARHIARREGHRNRSSAHGRPHFLVFSTHPNTPPSGPFPSASPSGRDGEDEQAPEATVITAPSPATTIQDESEQPIGTLTSSPVEQGSSSPRVIAVNQQGSSLINRRSPNHSSPNNQDRGGPSELQSFSESLRSRFNAVSSRCKESISKSTRGWKERLFSRNAPMADLGSEVRRDAGIATVSHMMERLEMRDGGRTSSASVSNSSENLPVPQPENQQIPDTVGENPLSITNHQASSATTSCSS
ncbi:hypothetical protein ACJRO7_003558 [Eucalyptus globulus]|uniref:RING-type E3 ubiquitin transferase n=1 Tax=Eucalyptus globulus TaxID=34317 RepID=A0ABD3IWU2_EUCGL